MPTRPSGCPFPHPPSSPMDMQTVAPDTPTPGRLIHCLCHACAWVPCQFPTHHHHSSAPPCPTPTHTHLAPSYKHSPASLARLSSMLVSGTNALPCRCWTLVQFNAACTRVLLFFCQPRTISAGSSGGLMYIIPDSTVYSTTNVVHFFHAATSPVHAGSCLLRFGHARNPGA